MNKAVEVCTNCGGSVSAAVRHCPACGVDVGPPNVRMAGDDSERQALTRRSQEAMEAARKEHRIRAVTKFASYIQLSSSVVITAPASFVRQIFDNPRAVYQNYETLVGSGVLQPTSAKNDRARATVGSWLFGSAAGQIVYGALSTTTCGLPTYGDVAMRLKPDAIKSRVSFLERNSYRFVEFVDPKMISEVPPGYRAIWENREELAIAKHGNQITNNQDEAVWETMLLSSDGVDRTKDEFIEAHIFSGITSHSVENLQQVNPKPHKHTIVDIRVAMEKFKSQKVVK